MGEDRGLLCAGAVRGEHDRAVFLAQTEDVDEEVGASLVKWERAQLVEEEQRGRGVWLAVQGETPGPRGGGPRVDHLKRTGQEPRLALAARGIAPRRGQGGPGPRRRAR